MTALEIAQQYFDGWNRRDASAVLATMAPGGTYEDPTTGGPLSGSAFAAYMEGLFAAFPDASFAVASAGLAGPDLVAAQWVMRGTNLGPMNGLPPSSKAIELKGSDFIRVTDGKIQSVTGYFDSGVIPRQLGLQVVVQPQAIGPFGFGTSVRVSGGNTARPGAFSITCLEARSAEESQRVADQSRMIAQQMLGMKGFISLVAATVGTRMMTISAWESPDDPAQMMRGGQHAESVKEFFGPDMAAGGPINGIFVPHRMNPAYVRCGSCKKMQAYAPACGCGAPLTMTAAW